MKAKLISAALVLTMTLVAGCATKTNTTPSASPSESASASAAPSASASAEPDVKTTASIVDNEEAFEKALGKEGTWIIASLKDLSFDKELVLDGDFKNGKKDDAGNEVFQRKIALYTQDENKVVTASFKLTAPKLTINSINARIQSGTFVGDVYVSAKNFQLVKATVEGNVYFTNEEAQSTFKMDEASKITGVQELKK